MKIIEGCGWTIRHDDRGSLASMTKARVCGRTERAYRAALGDLDLQGARLTLVMEEDPPQARIAFVDATAHPLAVFLPLIALAENVRPSILSMRSLLLRYGPLGVPPDLSIPDNPPSAFPGRTMAIHEGMDGIVRGYAASNPGADTDILIAWDRSLAPLDRVLQQAAGGIFQVPGVDGLRLSDRYLVVTIRLAPSPSGSIPFDSAGLIMRAAILPAIHAQIQ